MNSEMTAIVLAAVTNTGAALKYTSSKLRNDGALVLAAIQKNGWLYDMPLTNLKMTEH
jgi:hypothetical protein